MIQYRSRKTTGWIGQFKDEVVACIGGRGFGVRRGDMKKMLSGIPIGIRAEEALKKAVAGAIADHKRFGDSIVIWRDGKIVKIPANQIELHEHQAGYEPK